MDYNSYISEQDEPKYQAWLKQQQAKGQNVSDKDYDMRGFWLSGQAQAPNKHYTDEFKKPSHPTFSNESKYSFGDKTGGEWKEENGNWTFTPSKYNLQQLPADKLRKYISESDPEVKLNIKNYALDKLRGIK